MVILLPTGRGLAAVVLNVAWPVATVMVPLPSKVAGAEGPAKKLTVPVGLPAPAAAVTVAVRFTAWAYTDEAIGLSVTVVLSWPTMTAPLPMPLGAGGVFPSV